MVMLGAALQAADERTWRAVGHAFASPFGAWTRLAAGLLALTVAILVARAIAQHRRYRAVGVLGKEQVAQLVRAIAQAEQRTLGEIAVVVLERSEPHAVVRWRAAVGLMLLGTAALVPWLPWQDPRIVLSIEVLLFFCGGALAWWLPGLARAFLMEREAERAAEEQVLVEFRRQGLDRTAERSGVLLFVSLFERRAIVLGDRGIDERIAPGSWEAIDRVLLDGARGGRLAEALHQAIEQVGEALARHLPRPDGTPDHSEVADRVVVRRG
jgi:putative membrane protein